MWVCQCGDALGDLNERSIRTLVMAVVSFPLLPVSPKGSSNTADRVQMRNSRNQKADVLE